MGTGEELEASGNFSGARQVLCGAGKFSNQRVKQKREFNTPQSLTESKYAAAVFVFPVVRHAAKRMNEQNKM